MTELAGVLESLDDFSIEHQEHVVMAWVEEKRLQVRRCYECLPIGIGWYLAKDLECLTSLLSLEKKRPCVVFAEQLKY